MKMDSKLAYYRQFEVLKTEVCQHDKAPRLSGNDQ